MAYPLILLLDVMWQVRGSHQLRADQQVVEAEAEKKSQILLAEGFREAEVQKAEGEKRAQVLHAEATFEEEKLQAEAKFLLASREQEGLAQGYKAIVSALSSNPEAKIGRAHV